MIKDLGVVREPRGLSWQNWTATYKDVLTNHRKYLVVAGIVFIGVISGGIYLKQHAGAGYAKQAHYPRSTGQQLNLNDQSQSIQPASKDGSSTSVRSISSSVSQSAANLTQPIRKVINCDYTAMARAKLQYTASVTAENTYHDTQLSLIETSGTVSSLLSSSPTHKLVTLENARHTAALSSIQNTQSAALHNAGCK